MKNGNKATDMSANVENMEYKDVRPDDVAKQRIWAFGEFRSVAEAHIPVLQPIDIGVGAT
jgi:hypothetical protein